MNLNGTEYYYVYNAQGDIIGLIDGSGTQVVSYTYDSWGKLISTIGSLADTVGAKNPYRYRGYRYDTKTGLYYLQSRYYNPKWGRFINADDPSILQNSNGELINNHLYAYCGNNPVNKVDRDGNISFKSWCVIAGAIVGGIYSLSYYISHTRRGQRNIRSALLSLVQGAAAGGMVGLLSTKKGALVDGIIGALGGICSYLSNSGKNFSISKCISAAIGGYAGAVVGGRISGLFKVGRFAQAVNVLISSYIGCRITRW